MLLAFFSQNNDIYTSEKEKQYSFSDIPVGYFKKFKMCEKL